MSFTEDEIQAFKNEAAELLETAEASLLLLDKGQPLANHYDAVFRAFHSIKGAAGMMDMPILQNHMHQLETIFTDQKSKLVLEKPFVDLFLRGLDGTKTLLNGETLNFDYSVNLNSVPERPLQSDAVAKPKTFLGKILIVDDEPEIVDLLAGILNSEDIETLGLTSPDKVMESIETFKPDAIFTDFSMPGMNGLELLTLVSKSHIDLPVVFISGYVNKDVLLQAIHLGVFGVIEKPFDVLRVSECAINAIEKHRLTKTLSRSINLLMYQFSDLSDFLKTNGHHDAYKLMRDEITSLLEQRRAIKKRKQQAAK